MTIVDHEIAELARFGLVFPFDTDYVGPASLDIRIGEHILQENLYRFPDDPSPEWVTPSSGVKPVVFSRAKPYRLQPGEMVLTDSLEYFKLPARLMATLHLCSTLAREGYGHLLAGYIDPGYEGRLTFEIVNHRVRKELPLYPGMRFAQLQFSWVKGEPLHPYRLRGRYYKDTVVQGPRERRV